jgi:chromatin segregation and condensation protein Rec8/ScpA/Scc1 (kleisin family)
VSEGDAMRNLLIRALKNTFNMQKEDAIGLAETIENIFQGQEEIEDMSIDKYVRALFYELQREKLLKLRREEFKEKGKIMRKFYWSFNDEGIRKEAYRKQKENEYKIYQQIPDSAWISRIQCKCN